MIRIKKFKSVFPDEFMVPVYDSMVSSICSMVIAHNNGYIDLTEFYDFKEKRRTFYYDDDVSCLVIE